MGREVTEKGNNYYIGIDRKFALVVIIEAFHRLTYLKIRKALLAQAVKNTRLRRWYPESRELPTNDPYRNINPWYDAIFKDDLPQLEAMGFLEIDDGLNLTPKGRSFATELLGFPYYSQFKEEVFQLYRESKKGTLFKTEWFYKNAIQKSKKLYKEEVLLYDFLSAVQKYPLGVQIEPGKITTYFDVKSWLHSIMEKLNKEEARRAPSYMTQLEFLNDVCKKYLEAPLKEKPLVEVCGQCIGVEVYERDGIPETRFKLWVEGQGILVIARNFAETSGVEHHGLRVIGTPQIIDCFIQIEAIRIFDRGLSYPINGRAI